MSEIIKQQNNEIFTSQDVETIKLFKEYEVKFKEICNQKREQLLDYMKKNNLTSYNENGLLIVYKKPTTRKQVDTQKLKDLGIYNTVLKESEVSESVSISVKYE